MTIIHVSFSYRDALLLGDGSRTTSPRSDVHPHSASQLTHLTKGNAIIHKNTKKSKQALSMDKISTKASASDDSSNPKVLNTTASIVSAATPDTSSIMITKKVTQVDQEEVKGMMTGATDSSMMKMKKDTTISSSLKFKSNEEIPSTFVKKKNDHLSSTKEEYDSSSAIAVNVEDKETDLMKTKKHTAKALKIKEKEVETKMVTTISSSPIFSDQSKEKFLNEQLKIEAAPLLADKNKDGISHEPEAPDDSGNTTDSFFSSIHHRKSGRGLKKASKLMSTSYYEVSLVLVQKGSKMMMKNLKPESNLNGKSEENEEGISLDLSSAVDPESALDVGKKFINYNFFSPVLFFDMDGANNDAMIWKKIDSLSFLDCTKAFLRSAFQWDENQCLILVRDVSTKKDTIKNNLVLHEKKDHARVVQMTERTVKTPTTSTRTQQQYSSTDEEGNKIILLADVLGSLCSDSISSDEKTFILHNMERRIGSSIISLTPEQVEGGGKMNIRRLFQIRGHDDDRFGAGIAVSKLEIIDDRLREQQELVSNKIRMNNDSFMLSEFSVKSRSFEPGSTIKTSEDYYKLNEAENRNTCNEVERSGGFLSHKKRGGKAIFLFPFRSLGRKLWMHYLMVVALIFVQSPDNYALGKEIEVDEKGGLVDLTIQNTGRHLVKCEDVKGKFYISSTDQTKGCVWAQKQTVSRCKLQEVQENCRKTCGLCDTKETKSTKKSSKKGDLAERDGNTWSPSITPTDFLSSSTSFKPSSLSSSESSTCKDEPSWKYSVVDPEFSKFNHLVGKTCEELEDETVPELYDDFCQGIALNTGKSKCVLEGCCFCGGGTLREVTCVDIGNWYVSETINCDYISKLKDVDEQKAKDFCESWRKFYSDDMTPSEACCACGGGKHVHSFDDFVQDQRRKLNEEEEANEDEDVSVGGVPNLEFLGIGYDAIRGNPRGSSISELDPGFRHRVFSFSSGSTTLDGAYFVPKGTEFRYTSSCHYDSLSTEISSEKDYRESLSKESSFSNSVSVSTQGSYGIVAAKLETNVAWSESESYSSFKEKSVSENTVTFEAKAICSEFEVSFNPYSEKQLDPNFKRALNKLSLLGPFDPQSIEHKRKYRAFIDAYGTHYTKKVILGAKRILSTTMTSRDVAELTKDQVDISSTLSVDVQLAIGTADYVKDSLGGSFPESPEPTDPTVPDYLVHVINKTTPAAATPAPTPAPTTAVPKKGASKVGGLGVSASNKYDKFSASSNQAESANKISQKKIKTKELNFGGLPNVDWREWAASVKERPMPIMYENEGLWTLMDEEKQREAFLAALYHLEDFRIQDDIKDAFINIAHFGVATGSGDPLSESSVNPNASFRAMFQVDEIEGKEVVKPIFRFEEVGTNQNILGAVVDPGDRYTWTAWAKPSKSNYYMCGAKVDYDELLKDNFDDEGIFNIYFKFCKYGDWNKQSKYILAGNDLSVRQDPWKTKEKKCSNGKFVKKIHVRECRNLEECAPSRQWLWVGPPDYSRDDDTRFYNKPDRLGIHSLMIECCNPNDCENDIEYKEVHCEKEAEEILNNTCTEDPDAYEFSVGPSEISDEDKENTHINLILAGQVLEGISYSENAENYRDDDGHGYDEALVDMRIQWEEVKILNPSAGGGAFDNIATYATVWKGKIDRPTAIFANAIRGAIVHDTVEESEEFGFISYIKNKWTCDMDNNVMFGLSGDKISEDGEKSLSHGVFATSNFERQMEMSRLQSFSFATFENDPNLLDSIVTGVIRYDGVAVNTHGGRSLGFEVSRKTDETVYNVAFKKGNMKDVDPIVLLFPEWYLDSQIYPSNAGQVSVALTGSSSGSFTVKVGDKSQLDRSYLGFNFVAIDPSIVDIDPSVVENSVLANKTKNYSIGTSSSLTTSKDKVEKFEGSATEEYKGNMEGDLKYTRITFSSPFKTLPTLIVTPIINATDTIDNSNIPRCIIETLTKEIAVVKCDMLEKRDDDGCNATPIEFNYLAIGEREF